MLGCARQAATRAAAAREAALPLAVDPLGIRLARKGHPRHLALSNLFVPESERNTCKEGLIFGDGIFVCSFWPSGILFVPQLLIFGVRSR